MNTLIVASSVALTFSLLEILTTLRDEVKLMWARPRRITIVRVLYFFIRYFGLAVQINNAVISRFLNVRYPVPGYICRWWLGYQTVTIYLLLSSVDIILMIRVYAFYNRRRWIGLVMVALLLGRLVVSSTSAAIHLPHQKFNDACLNTSTPSEIVYFFILAELLVQVVVLGLTFFKHIIATRAGWARTPLVSLLCKDGAAMFIVLVALLIGTLVYARSGYMDNSAHAVFPTFVSLLSFTGCRLIISMQKLRREQPETPPGHDDETFDDETYQFTTIIESLWDNAPTRNSDAETVVSIETNSLSTDRGLSDHSSSHPSPKLVPS